MNDITLYITDRRGELHTVQAPTDMNLNLMEVIRSYDIEAEGSIGICGGMAMCASCQCYIESDHELRPASDEEEAMLSEAFHVKENSRLVCQLPLTEELDQLRVTVAQES